MFSSNSGPIIRAVIVKSLIVLILAGCTIQPREGRWIWRESRLLRPISTQLCDELHHVEAPITSGRGLVRISVDRNQERQLFRQVVAFDRAGRYWRIEFLPINGALTQGLLVVRANSFIYLDPVLNEAQTGEVSPTFLDRMFGLPLKVEDLSTLYLGRLPELSCDQLYLADLDPDMPDNLLVVTANRDRAWLVDPEKKLVRSLFINDPLRERTEVVLSFGDFVSVLDGESEQSRLGPLSAELSAAGFKLKADFKYSNWRYNLALRPELFDVQIPASYRVTGPVGP